MPEREMCWGVLDGSEMTGILKPNYSLTCAFYDRSQIFILFMYDFPISCWSQAK